jgi:hypothetical protein
MLIAVLLILIGIFVIISNPILGLIPGLLLIVVGIVVGVLALLGRGIGAIAGLGETKSCPDCRSRIPASATVCRHCGYRYGV